MPYVIGITGVYAGKTIQMPVNGSLMFGRDAVACQVVFPSTSRGVSRHHCVLKHNSVSGMFVIYDSGSSYGTFCNQGRIGSTPVAIKNGEQFSLGSGENTFEVRL